MSTVIKSLATDFGGTWNQSQLHQEIVADADITTTLIGISYETGGDVIKIIFVSTPPAGDLTALTNLIAAHVPVFSFNYNGIVAFTLRNTTRNSEYQKMGSTLFPGSTDAKIEIIAAMDSGVTSFNIKIFDKTNKNIIAEKNFTNTDSEILDMGTCANISSTPAVFEIFAQKVGGKLSNQINIENAVIKYI